MSESVGSKDMVTRHAWAFFGLAPIMLLAIIIVVSAVTELWIDHQVFGRNEDYMPALQETTFARGTITVWNLLVSYAAAPLVAVAATAIGRAKQVSAGWVILGGTVVCVLGGIQEIETVWTGVQGTSYLSIDIVESEARGIAKSMINLSLFAVSYWHFYLRSRLS